jgi:ketosteroid isomerase-like protein
MAHPNEEALRLGYEAFAKGDIETVMGLLTDDTQWHVPGDNLVSGDYSGKEEVGGFFGKLMELTGGTFRVDVHDVLANDEHATGLVVLRAEREGKTLAANDAHVWHVHDGKFSEFWSCVFDQRTFNDFWS